MNKYINITINGEYGTLENIVGKILSNRLDMKLADNVILEKATQELKLPMKYLSQIEEKSPSRYEILRCSSGVRYGMECTQPIHSKLFNIESEIIRQLAKKESHIFIRRCSNDILSENTCCVNIFLYGSIQSRLDNLKKYNLNKTIKQIKNEDKERNRFYRTYTGKELNDISQYDICLNIDNLDIDDIVNCIYTWIVNNKIFRLNIT